MEEGRGKGKYHTKKAKKVEEKKRRGEKEQEHEANA